MNFLRRALGQRAPTKFLGRLSKPTKYGLAIAAPIVFTAIFPPKKGKGEAKMADFKNDGIFEVEKDEDMNEYFAKKGHVIVLDFYAE